MSTATLEKIDQIVHLTAGWKREDFTLLKQRLDIAEEESGTAGDDDFEITDEQYAELQRRSREMDAGVNTCTWEEVKAMGRKIAGL